MSNPYAPPDPSKPRPPRPPVTTQQRPPARQRPPEPEPPPPTPEQARAVTSGVMWFGLLMLLTLLTYELPWPWPLLAPVAGVLAFVRGVRTIMAARRIRWRGMLVPMLVGGLLLTGLTTSGTTLDLALNWQAKVSLAQCRDGAITISAEERCQREYEEASDPANRIPTDG